MTSLSPVPRISVVDAAQEALERTRKDLFPFRFERWLLLGVLAFLDQCGRGGGGSFNPGAGGRPTGGLRTGPLVSDFSQVPSWLFAHLALIMLVAAGILVVVTAVMALILWVNCRGIFMYLEAIAKGTSDLGRSWREHAERANSLFAWRFIIAVGLMVTVMVYVPLLVGLILVLSFEGASLGAIVGAGLFILVLILLFIGLLILTTLVSLALRDFVAPLQIARGLLCGDAIRVLLPILRAHAWTFAGYVLGKVVLRFAVGILAILACCVTCCCALLPVVFQTVLQPVFYFERSWSLCLLKQLGDDLFIPAAGPLAAHPGGPPPLTP